MSSPQPRRSASDWDTIFDRFHASGMSQTAFCRQEDLSRFSFSHHYQRSEKFAGKRRERHASSNTADAASSGFRAVRKRSSPPVIEQRLADGITIHIGDDVRVECNAAVGLDVIARLARESRS